VQQDVFSNTAPIISELNNVQAELNWTPPAPEEKQKLKKELVSLIEKESLDERTSNELMRLFDADNWQILKGNDR
jgi:hypothetical protein